MPWYRTFAAGDREEKAASKGSIENSEITEREEESERQSKAQRCVCVCADLAHIAAENGKHQEESEVLTGRACAVVRLKTRC